ncbi:MAG TPA: proton-conducting transporter membrane subunit [Roseiflexaceae bacterium]|nr:proton-conducting transporter membrane subunit [Roseiflexaceae bacterium]
MAYLLLIFFPISISATCFVLRKQTQLVIVAATLTMLVQIGLLTQLPLDQSRLLGLTLSLDPLSRLFLTAFFCVAALAFLASWRIPHGENFVPVTLLMLGMTAATLLLLQEPFVVALLLVSTGLLAVLAIVDLPTGSPQLVGRRTIATALKYLVLMVIAGVMMYLAFVLLDLYRPGQSAERLSPPRLILGLLTVGFGLRLATVPFHSWLPDLAEDAAPMVSVIIVTVVNITSLLFLTNTFQFHPELVFENDRGLLILRAFGIATALLGGLLALGQPGLRRALGYLVIYDAGMVLFGLASVSSVGLAGALFEAFNQIIVVLLLFVSVGLLEQPDGRPPNVVRRDLLRRWPVAGTGFLCGSLALLGLPPFNGFASKLLIYQAAAQEGPLALGLLLLATGLALLALVRIAHERLLGPSDDQPAEVSPLLLGETDLDRPAERRLAPEPRAMAVMVSLLLAVCLGIGLYPQPLLNTINDVIQGLTFVKAI